VAAKTVTPSCTINCAVIRLNWAGFDSHDGVAQEECSYSALCKVYGEFLSVNYLSLGIGHGV